MFRPVLFTLFLALPLPAMAQGTPSPGMKSLHVLSDQDADVLYKLKQGGTKSATPTAPVPPTAQPPASTPSPYAPKTLTVIPDGAERNILSPNTAQTPASTETQPAKDQPAPDPTSSSLPDAETTAALDRAGLWPRTKLAIWDKAYLITAARNSSQRAAAIAAFESTPGRANPQDLMDIATLYAADKKMDLAARYYYAAQLRHAFDVARFPVKPIRTLQGAPTTSMIGTWAISSSERMGRVIGDVQEWDSKTPYQYRPSFPLPHPDQNLGVPSESDWPDILARTQDRFFKDLADISAALARMGK
jgi:hypothetical protein